MPLTKKPTVFTHFGVSRQDDYYWLREQDNPEVIAYLEAENAHFRDVMAPLQGLTDELYAEMVARLPKDEDDVAVQQGDFFKYTRREKELQDPIYARKFAESRAELPNVPEQITLDVNALANEGEYLDVQQLAYAPNGKLLAYTENRDGTDRFTVFIKDLGTGMLLSEVLTNEEGSADGCLAWSCDSKYLFYITLDEQQRGYKLWRHEIGTSPRDDVLLYEETDPAFVLYVMLSASDRFIFVYSYSTVTTEVRIIDAEHPLAPPRIFQARERGVEYSLEHWNNEFFILTNKGATNFKLLRCPLTDFTAQTEVVPYDDARFLEGIYPFQDHIFISGRENGYTQIWELKDNALQQLKLGEPPYSVWAIDGQSYYAPEILMKLASLTAPTQTIAADLSTGTTRVIKQNEVAGEFHPYDYTQRRVFATAKDGTKIPILLVYRNDALANGAAPLILEAYGAYGFPSDPEFHATRLPILDRGVILAIAQVRGGSEYGRTWYYQGRMEDKVNTFTDFIACAEYLVSAGYTTPQQLAGTGGSAGGLLIGAVANMADRLFKVLVADVPFVDVVTTMLDDTIPLTTIERDEWGDPNKEIDFHRMLSYSPYDNVQAKEYPAMFVTTGLHDPRVGYWEPGKWVAKLREHKTDTNPLVLKTHMSAGHGGSSGRLARIKEQAEMYAFVLTELGAIK